MCAFFFCFCWTKLLRSSNADDKISLDARLHYTYTYSFSVFPPNIFHQPWKRSEMDEFHVSLLHCTIKIHLEPLTLKRCLSVLAWLRKSVRRQNLHIYTHMCGECITLMNDEKEARNARIALFTYSMKKLQLLHVCSLMALLFLLLLSHR